MAYELCLDYLLIVVKYTLFAVVSTAVNLLTQWATFFAYSGSGAIYMAMVLGTLSGLVVKYLLDKQWIFYYTTTCKSDSVHTFGLYSLMGLFTTAIFWLIELLFNAILPFESAKYLGAIVGLSLGYYIKYHLDKRYVFR